MINLTSTIYDDVYKDDVEFITKKHNISKLNALLYITILLEIKDQKSHFDFLTELDCEPSFDEYGNMLNQLQSNLNYLLNNNKSSEWIDEYKDTILIRENMYQLHPSDNFYKLSIDCVSNKYNINPYNALRCILISAELYSNNVGVDMQESMIEEGDDIDPYIIKHNKYQKILEEMFIDTANPIEIISEKAHPSSTGKLKEVLDFILDPDNLEYGIISSIIESRMENHNRIALLFKHQRLLQEFV